MTIDNNQDSKGDIEILVELKHKRGEQDVAFSPSEIAEKSADALHNAMQVIYGMSRKVINTLKEVPLTERPSVVEVEFGLKLTSDAKALIVNTGIESQINVKLCWTRAEKDVA